MAWLLFLFLVILVIIKDKEQEKAPPMKEGDGMKWQMPIGVDNFFDIRSKHYYFVDKTDFIRQLIDGHSAVTLITWPRRFGKTLTLSMLEYFFSIEKEAQSRHLFDGLAIEGAGAAYMAHRGQYPVLFLSLKDFSCRSWPDMLDMAEEHGVKYTGVIIDNYEDDVSGDVVEQEDVQRFQYFGNMLLHQGGELGYHGYNHQPLSLSNVDYANILPYKTWESYDAMKKAMTELIRFGKEMFPGTELSVYVPPSNVLSDEGREMIVKEFPEIRTIASNYFVGDMAYTQEFEAAEDGIVEQPRIISGAVIDDYMELAAISELNMHFVNTHFMHPDDLLDEDRGARLGWKKLKKRLDEYMDWLYTSAPCLRNLTASELSGAIQRYGALVIDKDISDQELNLKLDNFYDEAYIMIRMNEGTPGNIEGGELTHITGNLYLLRAKEKSVKIEIR